MTDDLNRPLIILGCDDSDIGVIQQEYRSIGKVPCHVGKHIGGGVAKHQARVVRTI